MCFYSIESHSMIVCGTGIPNCWVKEVKVNSIQVLDMFRAKAFINDYLSSSINVNLKSHEPVEIKLAINEGRNDGYIVQFFMPKRIVDNLVEAGLSKSDIQKEFDSAMRATFLM